MYRQIETSALLKVSQVNRQHVGTANTPTAPSFFAPSSDYKRQCAFAVQLGHPAITSTDFIPKTIGRYQIGSELGRGGMGVVSRGIDEKGESVAIKTIHTWLSNSASSIGRFKEEGRLLSRIDCHSAPRFLEAGCIKGTHYYAMESFGSLNMRQLIDRIPEICLDDRIKISIEATRALDDIHRCRIVHGDIKPENILIELPTKIENGNDWKNSIKIADFGLSWFDDFRKVKFPGKTSGTLGYMAPELLDYPSSSSQQTDVYSLGVTLFNLLSGQPLFSDASDLAELKSMHQSRQPPQLANIVSAIGRQKSGVINKALRKNPSNRYLNAGEMLRALESAN